MKLLLLLLLVCTLFQINLAAQIDSVSEDNFYSKCSAPNSFSFVFLTKEATYEFVQEFITKVLPEYKFTFFVQNDWVQENPAYFHSRICNLHSSGHTIGLAISRPIISFFHKVALEKELKAFEQFTGIQAKFITTSSPVERSDISSEFINWCHHMNLHFVLVPVGQDIHLNDSTILANTVGILPYNLIERDSHSIDEQNTTYILDSIDLIAALDGKVVSLTECLTPPISPKSNPPPPLEKESQKPPHLETRSKPKKYQPKHSITQHSEHFTTKKQKQKLPKGRINNKYKGSKNKSKRTPLSSYDEFLPISTFESNNVVYAQDKSIRTLDVKKYKYVKEFDTSGILESAFFSSTVISTIALLILNLLFN